MENVKKLTARTEVRLMSKLSKKFTVVVGKSKFLKTQDEDGKFSFAVQDLEDPTNPRRNYKIADESKFITSIMNRTYYQQQEKGVKTPMFVTEQEAIPQEELFPEVIVEDVKEEKPSQKSPKKTTKKSSKKEKAKA